ncbi:ECF RNA polymerase sigma factor SigD [Planctomycetes bacterium Poly30]|uniref:ECF RNA polymerase sigma factor SigD n=1 Tax=Saltatorellus ferox TaxID=2528018 RepID=A0A518F1B6_9BACT|nr:ECF RNA polymerase sigma factor SigD [Planctomycetes bacterium Poly30]
MSSVLTAAAARGDRDALAQLLDRHLPALEAFVRLRAGRIVRSTESSADVVQSVCREVLQHADRFRHPSEGAFRRWLFRTALRKLVDRRDYHLAEKRDLLRSVPIADGGEASALRAVRESRLVDVYRSFSTPSHHAEVRDEIERVESALDLLSGDERDVIVQAYLLGLTRAEIAEEMGRTPGAVRVLLHRALAKLVDLMATDG